jgi:hypothetical protein
MAVDFKTVENRYGSVLLVRQKLIRSIFLKSKVRELLKIVKSKKPSGKSKKLDISIIKTVRFT